MANKHLTLTSLFDDIADAIREKTDGTSDIIADNFPDEIRSILKLKVQGSKTITSSTSQQTVTPDSGYDALAKVIVNGINGKIVRNGIYTPTSDTLQFTLTHGLGVIPDFCICTIYPMTNTPSSSRVLHPIIGFMNGVSFTLEYATNKVLWTANVNLTQSWQTQTQNETYRYAYYWSDATTSNIKVGGEPVDYNGTQEFKKGVSYHWLIGKVF